VAEPLLTLVQWIANRWRGGELDGYWGCFILVLREIWLLLLESWMLICC